MTTQLVTIRVSVGARNSLKAMKRGGANYDSVVNDLLAFRLEHADLAKQVKP